MRKWPLESGETVALVALVLIAAGAAQKWGPGDAALIVGGILLVGYALREAFGVVTRG